MRWLIRRVIKQGKGAVSYEEDVHFGDVLSIGRAADQAIFLSDIRAALNHARVTSLGPGRYKVESLILSGIRVNGELTYETDVAAGAVLEIASNRITLLDPPRDFEAAVEIGALDKAEQEAVKAKRAKPTSLKQTWLGKRLPSWILFVAVLLFGLLLPAASHFLPALGKALHHSPLPSTAAWNPGPLDAAHRFFGDDCKQCHATPFLTVRDTACTTCHTRMAAHADPARFNLPQLGEARCASCHQDHLGLAGMVNTQESLCSTCHTDLKTRTANASQLDDATDFGRHHPQFRVRLPAWQADGGFAPQLTRLSEGLKENSGLKFDHALHLKPELNSPKGRRNLQCSTCHQPDAGGLAMKPVDFESMCHDCHTLGFDTFAPDRQVPHAKVAEVVYMLDDYYAKRALEGGYTEASAPGFVQQRRRPGEAALSQQETVEALSWARNKSRQVADSLFTGRACVTCHAVSRDAAAANTPGSGWKIAPVRVAGIWYGEARFTHAKHSTMQCKDCHNAEASASATDLLIPGIDNCRQCHAGESGGSKVASTCIACHRYHQSTSLQLKQL
ncbi:cytochrome c3-like protein [Tahibacter aquaticus]|uniref:Cytochrome c3-like protein n=1 Tax=Tahibacter aquaticus TaxID=520092 RepID=A0A4V3DLR2_9GAMM|nr:cytochrome c3 family protein [Tahibacter aquaticus]TDR40820.1 cytochrome c3-like protein [Tahibacter aquaticus]